MYKLIHSFKVLVFSKDPEVWKLWEDDLEMQIDKNKHDKKTNK